MNGNSLVLAKGCSDLMESVPERPLAGSRFFSATSPCKVCSATLPTLRLVLELSSVRSDESWGVVMECYEEEVRNLERLQPLPPREPGPVAFFGSSSLRLWESLDDDFRGVGVVNLAFGGSTLAACARFLRARCPAVSAAFIARLCRRQRPGRRPISGRRLRLARRPPAASGRPAGLDPAGVPFDQAKSGPLAPRQVDPPRERTLPGRPSRGGPIGVSSMSTRACSTTTVAPGRALRRGWAPPQPPWLRALGRVHPRTFLISLLKTHPTFVLRDALLCILFPV